MKNPQDWRPGKYSIRNGRLMASRDPKCAGISSRLVINMTAALYAEAIPGHCGGALLDLGCGKVPLYEAYHPHVTSNICVDWPNSKHENNHLDIEHDLTQPLPLAAEQFGAIILSDVLEHIPTPAALWDEMARVLAPGGKILLNTPFYYPIHEAPHDFHRYTGFALRRLAEQAGLEVLVLEPTGGIVEIFADLSAKIMIHVPLFGSPCAAVVQAMAFAWWRTSPGRRLANKTGKTFPFGYFMIVRKPETTSP